MLIQLPPEPSKTRMRVIRADPGQMPTAIAATLINCYSTLANPAYFRAIAFLSQNLASFPRSVRMKGHEGEDDAHPLARLLRRRPNGYQNSFQFWSALFFHATHNGNGYGRIQRGAGYTPVALHNLCPEHVTPFRYQHETHTAGEILQFYLYKPTNGATPQVFPAADVIHLQGMSHDGMAGMDPVELHTRTHQKAATLDNYQTHYLQKGTVIRGSIEVPVGVDEERLEQMQDLLARQFNGPEAERDILILSDGAKLENKTLTPQQSQLHEQKAATTKDIAQITGVPPQFLFEYGEVKYINTIEQMGQDVVRYCFRLWIEQAEDELTLKLLSIADQDAGHSVRINPEALLRGDTKTQTDTLLAQVAGRVRTPNEARVKLDLPELDDPEADKLKATGDTSPAKAPAAPAKE